MALSYQDILLNEETHRRWREVEKGNVISHEKVVAWLNSWGTNNELPVPICDKTDHMAG